jgi:site-specific recombinase XerD
LRVIIKQIDELISCCEQEITMREYCNQHQKIIRKGWDEFRRWMTSKGYGGLDEKIANSYCNEVIGTTGYDNLTDKDKKRIRSARMLLSYQKDGDFEYRFPTKQRVLKGASGTVMQQYLEYLRDVLVLKEVTISNKLHYLLLFNDFLELRGYSLEHLVATTISEFFQYQQLTLPMVHNCNSTLKLFFVYMFDYGITVKDYSNYIIQDNYRKNCKIPTTYTEEEISRLVAAVSRSSAIGKRDYLIILLAAEYGWRASDIVKFNFGQIDWDKNTISFQLSKTDVPAEYPLLSSVGNALIDYLKNGRPVTAIKEIIVSAESSKRGKAMNKTTIHSIVAKYMSIANIKDWRQKKHGPHALRHSLASNLLKKNVSMQIIGDVLIHESMESTKIYLSIDFDKLKECPLPIPTIKTVFYRGWQA